MKGVLVTWLTFIHHALNLFSSFLWRHSSNCNLIEKTNTHKYRVCSYTVEIRYTMKPASFGVLPPTFSVSFFRGGGGGTGLEPGPTWLLILLGRQERAWSPPHPPNPPPPFEASLVIFARRALILLLKALGKSKMTPLLCACAVVISLETQSVEKGHLAPSNLVFLLIAIDGNGFRRTKEEENI